MTSVTSLSLSQPISRLRWIISTNSQSILISILSFLYPEACSESSTSPTTSFSCPQDYKIPIGFSQLSIKHLAQQMAKPGMALLAWTLFLDSGLFPPLRFIEMTEVVVLKIDLRWGSNQR